MFKHELLKTVLAASVLVGSQSTTFAGGNYDVGATDTEIKIGGTMPYSGPASSFGIAGRTYEAYFRKINDEGGVNGRKINYISYDDAYSPPKTVEQVRRLIESDEVLFLFSPLGTPTNSAIHKYMNQKKIPQLFIAGASEKWNDPKNFPWTMGIAPSYRTEGIIYGRFLLIEKSDAKIAVLYQNDDYGKELLKGLKEGLGEKASSIVVEESYEVSEPTVDSHIAKLKATNADVFVNITTPKFAAQSIKKVAELGWKPYQIVNAVGNSLAAVLRPAGLQNAQGLISSAYNKDASDPQWKDDPGVKGFNEFLGKYMPGADRDDGLIMGAYNFAQTVIQVLKQCGDDLTRENVMRQAASLKDFVPTALYPGIKINTDATDYAPIKELQMIRFEGDRWVPFGGVVNAR